jgi:ribose/xylose/arabinose/galactoside ABC-type transport system permease subunit
VALIGFGAILALGSIAFPWYLFGATQASDGQSLSNILEMGWRWFPGAPLVLIALSTIMSSIAGLLSRLTRVRPIITVVAGMVTLISATWLWQGYSGPADASGSDALGPTTGAMLATVGAIVLVAAGLWMRSMRSR